MEILGRGKKFSINEGKIESENTELRELIYTNAASLQSTKTQIP